MQLWEACSEGSGPRGWQDRGDCLAWEALPFPTWDRSVCSLRSWRSVGTGGLGHPSPRDEASVPPLRDEGWGGPSC